MAKTKIEKLVEKEAKLEKKRDELFKQLSETKLYKDYDKAQKQYCQATVDLMTEMVENITEDSIAGEAVDLYRNVKDFIDTISAQVKLIPEVQTQETFKSAYKQLEKKLVELFKKQNLTQVAGNVGKLSYFTETVANIEDWDVFTKYLAESGNWELIQKRINNAAYRELLENKENVKGVKQFKVDKTRIGKK